MNRAEWRRARRAQPNYLPPLKEALASRQVPPGVHVVTVKHDPGCSHWKGLPCDCSPGIDLGAVQGVN